ncbi:hypothetical protein GCM10029992_56480 [Glycomyces albus]
MTKEAELVVSTDSFGARDTLRVGDSEYDIYRIDRVEGHDRLPYSLKVLLENLLRNEDGVDITADHIRALGSWDPTAKPSTEIQFTPARVIMQDFTGVPCVVDLATMREAVRDLGGDPARINPLAPAELVIDHSVIVDFFGHPDSFKRNVEREYERNRERYQFLRWGQTAFDEFKVVPPGTGIVHQVNIEHLARVVMTREGTAYPDTCVGTDSHHHGERHRRARLGCGRHRGRGGHARPADLDAHPRVLGFKLTGDLPAGATATDLVLTITEILREHGVVGKFVEFYGDGVASVPVADRSTLGNMSPEFGSTCAIFPIDELTVDYLRLTGRDEEQIGLVEAYAKAQGLWHDPSREARYSEYLELDLSTVVPSIAGPKRPQDRISLDNADHQWRRDIANYVSTDEGSRESFPASDTPAETPNGDRPRDPQTVKNENGEFELDHGAVVIAAITSCTNTSNPYVMVGAGLLAKNAVEAGLDVKPWVKTSLAPGSQVVTGYLTRAGLSGYLDKLGFNLVGYGCTTCIGNSGPLSEEISAAVRSGPGRHLGAFGQPQLRGPHQPRRQDELPGQPAAGGGLRAGRDDGPQPDHRPARQGHRGPGRVHARHLAVARGHSRGRRGQHRPGDVPQRVRLGVRGRRDLEGPADPDRRHLRVGGRLDVCAQGPYFDGMPATPAAVEDVAGARVLAKLGDSVTTDHISPAGAIKADSPAGEYLESKGVSPKDFNSYGSRRGNHEIMVRGTFANIRLRNQLAPGTEGGWTRDFTRAEAPVTTIYEAAQNYAAAEVPLVVLAGKEYGTGSSRDWAAKGTRLLGVKAVIAESYERIHRSNLIGMGVLPLQFPEGASHESLGLNGEETVSITGMAGINDGIPETVKVKAVSPDGEETEFDATVRLDTPGEADYFRNGGILQYVLRNLLAK